MPLRDLGLILIICVVWGGNFTAAAQGMQHFSPFLFMILRFLLVLAILFPFLRKPPPGQWGTLIAVCLFMGGLHFTLMFWALSRSEEKEIWSYDTRAITSTSYIAATCCMPVIPRAERM